jgi:hypothetical protein
MRRPSDSSLAVQPGASADTPSRKLPNAVTVEAAAVTRIGAILQPGLRDRNIAATPQPSRCNVVAIDPRHRGPSRLYSPANRSLSTT